MELSQELRNHWISRRFSITQLGSVIRTLEWLQQGVIEIHAADRLHAKLYAGANHAFLGSSNFSVSGTQKQHEANIRVARASNKLLEREQYDGIRQLAENFFVLSDDYSQAIAQLLEKLLKPTSWQEAIGLAVAEMLNGEWIKKLEALANDMDNVDIWPTQRDGLAQALFTLHHHGNVLIADPTGSGKTRMISALRLALLFNLVEKGYGMKASVLVISPPSVRQEWEDELRASGRLGRYPVSIGALSNPRHASYKQAVADLRVADILIVDEAHRFLRDDSNRSEALGAHAGQFAILATATPINQRAQDLLRILELLDVDNLPDAQLADYRKLWKMRYGRKVTALNRGDLQTLQEYVQQFLVRRTKRQLNARIEAELERYRNRLNNLCRFPTPEGFWYEPKLKLRMCQAWIKSQP